MRLFSILAILALQVYGSGNTKDVCDKDNALNRKGILSADKTTVGSPSNQEVQNKTREEKSQKAKTEKDKWLQQSALLNGSVLVLWLTLSIAQSQLTADSGLAPLKDISPGVAAMIATILGNGVVTGRYAIECFDGIQKTVVDTIGSGVSDGAKKIGSSVASAASDLADKATEKFGFDPKQAIESFADTVGNKLQEYCENSEPDDGSKAPITEPIVGTLQNMASAVKNAKNITQDGQKLVKGLREHLLPTVATPADIEAGRQDQNSLGSMINNADATLRGAAAFADQLTTTTENLGAVVCGIQEGMQSVRKVKSYVSKVLEYTSAVGGYIATYPETIYWNIYYYSLHKEAPFIGRAIPVPGVISNAPLFQTTAYTIVNLMFFTRLASGIASTSEPVKNDDEDVSGDAGPGGAGSAEIASKDLLQHIFNSSYLWDPMYWGNSKWGYLRNQLVRLPGLGAQFTLQCSVAFASRSISRDSWPGRITYYALQAIPIAPAFLPAIINGIKHREPLTNRALQQVAKFFREHGNVLKENLRDFGNKMHYNAHPDVTSPHIATTNVGQSLHVPLQDLDDPRPTALE